jgi:tetratricopeptide (TPR) repeat protein
MPFSVIVTASGTPEQFRTGLASLRPTLGLHDEALCVVPDDRADLRAEPWLRVVDGDPLAVARHPVVVFLDGDVIVSAHWLDPLAQALADPDVVAAGPRCHRSFGPQDAPLPDGVLDRPAAFKTFARQWRQDHRGQFTAVDALGPVCFAVRRAAAERAPSFDRLAEHGRVVLAHGALIAHVGSDQCVLRSAVPLPGPLISACLIVKDEEDVLADCLSSVRSFVDEIVVYDTGSTDRTREIARDHGARVIEGYWNDHFADARNRALTHCLATWILHVDADETASCDPTALRARLAATVESGFLVAVDNLRGHAGTASSFPAWQPRLFRRDLAGYVGRLHEHLVDRITGESLVLPQLSELALVHSGYTVLRRTVKDKFDRNLRLAHLAVDDEPNDADTLMNLGRTELGAGRIDAAIDTFRKVLAAGAGGRARVMSLKVLIDALLRQGRLDEANEALSELRKVCTSSITADHAEAQIRFAEGDFARTLAILQSFPEEATDDALCVLRRDQLAELEIKSLFNVRRFQEAGQRLRDCLRSGELPMAIVDMAHMMKADGASLAEVATLFPHQALRGLLHHTSDAPDALVDELIEALWQRYPGEPVVLAVAARIGGRLPIIRAMEWATRLRQHGHAERCTLLALARDQRRTARERALAGAVVLEMFADNAAMEPLEAALSEVPDTENAAVLEELRVLAPGVAAAVEPVSA